MSEITFDTYRDALNRHLDWFAVRDSTVPIWWRDDDAIAPSPALDRLIAIANRYEIEVALAVIPQTATPALAARIAAEPFVSVLQHGVVHQNFQDKSRGEKAAEFGARRDPQAALAEIASGHARLTEVFGTRFVPIFVPPWNRLAPRIAAGLPAIGFKAISAFTQFHPRALPYLQTQIDMIKWKKGAGFIGWRSSYLRFDYQLARRQTNPHEPLGILSHHLVQNDACFEFLDRTFEILKRHPGARFARASEFLAA